MAMPIMVAANARVGQKEHIWLRPIPCQIGQHSAAEADCRSWDVGTGESHEADDRAKQHKE